MERSEAVRIIQDKSRGTKAVTLVMSLPPELLNSFPDVSALLEEMVHNKELVEVEYVLPDHPHVLKSIYFPPRTQIFVYSSENNFIIK